MLDGNRYLSVDPKKIKILNIHKTSFLQNFSFFCDYYEIKFKFRFTIFCTYRSHLICLWQWWNTNQAHYCRSISIMIMIFIPLKLLKELLVVQKLTDCILSNSALREFLVEQKLTDCVLINSALRELLVEQKLTDFVQNNYSALHEMH